MNEEKLKEMAKPNKVGRAREFLQHGRKDEVYGENEYYRKGFLDGGLYADSHPKNPWISVEERLPEPLTICAVWLKDDDLIPYISLYDSEGFLLVPVDATVTHWMPIPELKKGGEK